ncbi:hypothetical protein FOMG_15111 [Fusarium oxysporum f. sp. melonis 26406]|uniref:Uncharacterized protein n=1 Tax=Fusarium oxysporum f. sp. melonis 26406 TaxID=1089452 RepID=W9ZK59_FUSOX|nr:hypothetical protein FOMG_15111 [Fusarium oxysporum f. sp. melonis 26406]
MKDSHDYTFIIFSEVLVFENQLNSAATCMEPNSTASADTAAHLE